MPLFRPPVTAGRLIADPAKRRRSGAHALWSHYGAWAAGQTVWKDAAGAWHSSSAPYQGGAVHRVFDGGVLVSETAVDAGLATAQEVYQGGHVYEVTEAKRDELVAAGFFVGGRWESEEARWETYALSSETNRGFKTGDATFSLELAGQSMWGHADTIIGSYDADGFLNTNTSLVKSSAVMRATGGTFTGQVYGGVGPKAAWQHPDHPSRGFTPMDAVWDSGTVGVGSPVVVGWSEPIVEGVARGEGLICQLHATFLVASAFYEYPTKVQPDGYSRWQVTSVHPHDGYHYMVGRHWDLRPLLPNGLVLWQPFNNDGQRNWNRVGRCPFNSLTSFAAWEFWDGTAWTSDLDAVAVSDAAVVRDTRGAHIDGIADITFHNDRWLMAVIHPARPVINLYWSADITGPWTLYHSVIDEPRVASAGPNPPTNKRYWFGYPKFHEYLSPDAMTLIVSYSQGVYTPVIGLDTSRNHVSINVPCFAYCPTPEAVS